MALPALVRDKFRDLFVGALTRNETTTARFSIGGTAWKFVCTPSDDGYTIRLVRRLEGDT